MRADLRRLVTGRVLSDLEQAAGAWLCGRRDSGKWRGSLLPKRLFKTIGQPAAAELLEEFQRRGIEFTIGQCVLEADAKSAPQILSVIRELQLPLVLMFIRGRLMVLPQGVSRASGYAVPSQSFISRRTT